MARSSRRTALFSGSNLRRLTLPPATLYFCFVVQSSIQVGVNGDAVWVKVEGKGSFLNSGNLKEFTREMVNRGYREIVVDLENCAMMDSTFMEIGRASGRERV